MDIYTIRDNLVRTIAGKELLYEKLTASADPAHKVLASVLVLNLKELEAILADVKVCCANNS